MTIAIIEGCGNNIASVTNALTRLKCDFKLTTNAKEIENADKVILPGVGSARNAMDQLRVAGLVNVIQGLQQPVLGICLGMQLLFEYSEEQDVNCLAIIPGIVKKIPQSQQLPVPHMGWNRLTVVRQNPVTMGADQQYCYFIHSFYLPVSQYTIATVNYGVKLSAIVQRSNFYGMQFHPEKSGQIGSNLLENFVRLT